MRRSNPWPAFVDLFGPPRHPYDPIDLESDEGRAVRVVPEPGPGPVRAHDAEGRLVALGHTDPLRRTFVPEKVLH